MPQPYELNEQTWTGDGAVKTLTFGFKPRKLHIINLTDRIEWIKTQSMADANSLKRIANGTGTLEAGSDVVLGDKTTALSAGLNVNASVFYAVAEA